MKTLDDLVIGRNGLWFTLEEASKAFQQSDSLFMYDSGGSTTEPVAVGVRLLGAVISKEQFQQRAKELGFVGRYRWGVEYATDGKRPELADDVVVSAESNLYKIGELSDAESAKWNWKVCVKFKITDQRYKPADTSCLDKPDSSLDNGADWYDYDNQKALRLPPVGSTCKTGSANWSVLIIAHHDGKAVYWDYHFCEYESGKEFRPLDHDRKAKAERKRVVDAVMREFPAANELILCDMYDKGFLRLPD
jgi:hypothetical protein